MGYDYVVENKNFNDEDAVVRLGVGKNMVSSIRFWLKAFNIVDNNDSPTEFGKKLLDDEIGHGRRYFVLCNLQSPCSLFF